MNARVMNVRRDKSLLNMGESIALFKQCLIESVIATSLFALALNPYGLPLLQ